MSDIGGVADGQLLVRYQIGQTQRIEREREGDRESLVLVHSLGSPARFVPWEIYKRWSYKKLGYSEDGRSEPNISYKHRDLASRMPASGWNRRRVSVISNIARTEGKEEGGRGSLAI